MFYGIESAATGDGSCRWDLQLLILLAEQLQANLESSGATDAFLPLVFPPAPQAARCVPAPREPFDLLAELLARA